MNTKAKEIKVSTLESRFNKLHDAARYAEDCSKAILFHAGRLLEGDCTEKQQQTIAALENALEEWSEPFAALASAMQQAESRYMDHLSEDHQKCRLIEAVPAYDKRDIPNTFQISEKLFTIGYYEMEEDLYGAKSHLFTAPEILADLQDLHQYVSLCISALDHATYEGIWEEVGNRIHDLFDHLPDELYYKLLDDFGVKTDAAGEAE